MGRKGSRSSRPTRVKKDSGGLLAREAVTPEQANPTPERGEPRFFVGIGASAGGLEALRSFLANVVQAPQMCFVVVQHLAPQHRSRLVEILGHGSHLPVKEVTQGEALGAAVIYITPPNADVEIDAGRFNLCKPTSRIGPKPSIDRFFTSLAAFAGANAIGIILSGTGSDGAQGIRAIKAAGGVTMAQTNDTAKYDGMPRAAKQTGAVDLELTCDEMAKHLATFSASFGKSSDSLGAQWEASTERDPYRMILSHIETETGVNFSQYRQSTLHRRIARRMGATGCQSLHDYASYLAGHPAETRDLFSSVLISVTRFFRDGEAFVQLQRHLQERVLQKQHGHPLRVWIVGCASGEEAYSVAILLRQILEATGKRLRAQVFATDLDEAAMAVARKGVYTPTQLAMLTQAQRDTYFEPCDNDCLRARSILRDMLTFSRHDVTGDPPFLRLDLICCRNLLIYFNPSLQEAVLSRFHYALNNKGLLFLGRSEATGTAAELFHVLDKSAKIYQRSHQSVSLPPAVRRKEHYREAALFSADRETTAFEELLSAMVAGFAPDSVLLDESQRVRRVFGHAAKILSLPEGEPTTEIAKLLPDTMVLEASALLHRAAKFQRAVHGRQQYDGPLGAEKPIQMSVVPLSYDGEHDFLLCFNERRRGAVEGPQATRSGRVGRGRANLEQELIAVREHADTLAEEHATAVEEMQALNEELQSSNEELQSTNEELETANEELQSANEELTTLNQEITVKSSELQVLNTRLKAVQNAIFYPLVMLDSELRLADFNQAAQRMFRLSDADKGRDFVSLSCHSDLHVAREVVVHSRREGKDHCVQLEIGERSFEVRVQLCQGEEVNDGLAVSFVENTALTSALARSQLYENRLTAILDNTPAMVTMKDATGVYVYANQRFSEVLGVGVASILGQTDEELFGDVIGGQLRQRDFEVLGSRQALQCRESIPMDGSLRHWLSSKFPLLDAQRRAQSICSIAMDMTDMVRHEQQLELFKQVVSEASLGIIVLERRAAGMAVLFVFGPLVERAAMPASEESHRLDAIFTTLLPGFPEVDAGRLEAELLTGKGGSYMANLTDGGDQENWVEVRSSLITLNDGLDYVILSLFDMNEHVHDQKVIQTQNEEMSHFSKLAALGEVAAGISHEINTPLNVIGTKVDLLRRLASREQLQQERVHAAADDIDRMVKNITNVITGLKTLTGMESEAIRPHPLKTLIDEAIRLCDLKLQQYGIKLVVNPVGDDIHINCFPVQIVQILVNLINNAIDAIADLKERWIRVVVTLSRDKQRVGVQVIDSGKGIDASVAEKVMTPFFTTKRSRQGTGLGLSLSRTIARRHGGELSLQQNQKNTSFLLEIPLQLH